MRYRSKRYENPNLLCLISLKRKEVQCSKLPLEEFGTLHFHAFDKDRYPCVEFARKAMEQGGTMLACLNAANEVAVYAFLAHQIPFLGIEKLLKLV